MLDIIKHLEIGDKKYPMVATINVLEKIQQEYGTIEKWQKLMLGFKEETKKDKKGNETIELVETNEISLKDMKFFVLESINEGIDIENEKLTEKREFITEKQAGRIITQIGVSQMLDEITSLLNNSNRSSEEEEIEKN